MRLMEQMASRNRITEFDSYLGGGAYEHHIPAFAAPICQKSEFLTCYTPYQAEASQGMLQVIFEFQSVICALTGLDVSNASLYDGASACAEALLMTLRQQRKRKQLLILGSVNPHYQDVVDQYLGDLDVEVERLHVPVGGRLDMAELDLALSDQTAAVLIQSPNFYGTVEDVAAIRAKAQEFGALTVLCANPLAYGLYHSAGELGVDIAVGDTQPFGLPLAFGGPYCGYIACRQALVRQMPGRIVGETEDLDGKRGFVLTLQAREQHIRRDKATSNICSNQSLASLASLLTILWYGKEGVKDLARTNFQRASYLRHHLAEMGCKVDESLPIFNEFVLHLNKPWEAVRDAFRAKGIEPGLSLAPYGEEGRSALLVTVTEVKSKAQLDHYLAVAKEVLA
jgi:glycine dehydrogenase subunit 1